MNSTSIEQLGTSSLSVGSSKSTKRVRNPSARRTSNGESINSVSSTATAAGDGKKRGSLSAPTNTITLVQSSNSLHLLHNPNTSQETEEVAGGMEEKGLDDPVREEDSLQQREAGARGGELKPSSVQRKGTVAFISSHEDAEEEEEVEVEGAETVEEQLDATVTSSTNGGGGARKSRKKTVSIMKHVSSFEKDSDDGEEDQDGSHSGSISSSRESGESEEGDEEEEAIIEEDPDLEGHPFDHRVRRTTQEGRENEDIAEHILQEGELDGSEEEFYGAGGEGIVEENTSEIHLTLKQNVDSMEEMLSRITQLQSDSKKVNQLLHIYRNQEVILKQTCEYESTTLASLVSELHQVQEECNELKRAMKSERMQTVAGFNDELYEAEQKLVTLREESTTLDAEIAELDADFVLLDQQLLLTDASWLKQEHKRRKKEKKMRLKAGDGTEDTLAVTTQSLLASDKLFECIATLPSDKRVEEFMKEGEDTRPTEPRVLRILGEYMKYTTQ